MPEEIEEVEITDENGKKRSVRLIDVEAVLAEHQVELPVITSLGALVLQLPSLDDYEQTKQNHKSWLVREGAAAIAEGQRLSEKKDDLTEVERATLAELAVKAWPYTSEMVWVMVKKPKMTLEKFRQLIRAMPADDWLKLQSEATGFLTSHHIDLKN